MRILSVVGVLVVAACQPMYRGTPAKLHEPKVVDHKDVPTETPKAPLIDKCTTERSVASRVVPREAQAEAGTLVSQGDGQIKQYATSTSDDRGLLVRRAIDNYRAALVKDPYNVDATLQLARAYDTARRQGCAIVMLKRLSQLSARFPTAATAIDDIVANDHWFEDYRDEAKAAIGR
jgi:hypothetical protein